MPVGVSILRVKHRDTSKAVGAALESIVAMAAMTIESEAKQLAPVDTGHLRASIGAVQEGRATWVVRAAAHYALYVEMGTRYMGAQPYMRPAIERARARVGALSGITVRVAL